MKGFIFSLDVLFSILLLSVFTFQVTNIFSSSLSINTWQNTRLEKQAEDILNALYNREDLQSLNSTRIANSLTQLVPAGLGARIQIETYTVDGLPRFVRVNTSTSTSIGNASEIVQSRRPFVTFYTDVSGNVRLQNSSLAKIWVWLK